MAISGLGQNTAIQLDLRSTAPDQGVQGQQEATEAALKALGLELAGARLISEDGFFIAPATNTDLAAFEPEELLGASLSGTVPPIGLGDKLGWMSSFSEGSLSWMTALVLLESSREQRQSSSEAKRAMEEIRQGMKFAQVEAKEKQIEKEKKSAKNQFFAQVITKIAEAAISVASGPNAKVFGAISKETMGLIGTGLTIVGQGIQLADQTKGAGYQAKQAELEQQWLGFLADQVDSVVEEFRNSMERYRDEHRKTLELLERLTQEQTQFAQKITNI